MSTESNPIEDIQALPDDRHVALDEVGVSDLRLPFTVRGCERGANREQVVQATLRLGVSLVAERKGIHMSRLIESVLAYRDDMTFERLGEVLAHLRERQGAGRAGAEFRFDYFLDRKAPWSGKTAPQPCRCVWSGELDADGLRLRQEIVTQVKTLCPCSKEISDYGAHNQRADLAIVLHQDGPGPACLCLEEVVEIAERCASSPLYPILKREDERQVTMQAYENPCFVEDVARNAATELAAVEGIGRHEVRILNHESIHTHNAYAVFKTSL